MNALHRKVAAGGFGGLAAAAAIGGIAFACTPIPNIQVFAPGTTDSVPVVQPGQVVDVQIKTFAPGLPVVLAFDTPATATAPAAVSIFPTAPSMVGPSFVVSVTIPVTAQPTTAGSKPSSIVANQYDANGNLGTNTSMPVFVGGGTTGPVVADPIPVPISSPTPTLAPTPTPIPSVTPAPAPAPSTATPSPAGTAAPAPRAGGTAPAPVAAPRGAPAATSAPATAGAPAPAALPAAAPAGTPASPLVAGAPVAQPLAPTSDLWSGLSADTTASLLDTAPVQRSTGGLPVGAILLGSGVVALAGVALAGTRRKLAASRIVRR